MRRAIRLAAIFGVPFRSGIDPKDRIARLLEVLPVLIGAILAIALPGRLHDRQLDGLGRESTA